MAIYDVVSPGRVDVRVEHGDEAFKVAWCGLSMLDTCGMTLFTSLYRAMNARKLTRHIGHGRTTDARPLTT
ncbi:hypothetical protein BJX76DRAFT_324957 [Aspergillus varians]